MPVSLYYRTIIDIAQSVLFKKMCKLIIESIGKVRIGFPNTA